MNGTEAKAIVTALVWGAQKSRSNMVEAVGDDQAAQALLEELNPWEFGPRAILPQLAAWQGRVNRDHVVYGRDLFNFLTLITMKAPGILICCAVDYDVPESPDITWMPAMWEVP